MVEPFTSLFRTASHCKHYLMKGVSFSQPIMKELVVWINKTRQLDMDKMYKQSYPQSMRAAETEHADDDRRLQEQL